MDIMIVRLTHTPAGKPARGTAIVMIVVISVILTGLVLAVAWGAGIQAQMTGARIELRQANMAAESAGQIAVWNFKHDNSWRQALAPTTLPTLTIGSQTFTYATTCTDIGAVATIYWPYSEGSGTTTADASGHGNTGTFHGGVSWATGRYGNGLKFNGTDGYLDAGNNSSTNITGSFTMAAWVLLSSAAQDQKIAGNEDGVCGGYKMAIFGQKVELEMHDTVNTFTCNRNVPGGTIIPPGVWYHVCSVYDYNAGTISSYVNGVLDRQLTGVSITALASTAGHLIVGREPWISGSNLRYFNGIMDELRIYSRVLSVAEIKTLANSSVHIHSVATLKTTAPAAPTATVDFNCSAPSPLPPVAPALTVGGNLAMKLLFVSGDVQATGSVTVNSTGASSVNGRLTYGTSFADTASQLSVTYQGHSASPTQNSSATCPTINYASIIAQAAATYAGGSNQTFQFTHVDNGVAVFVITGNCTDPVIDTSITGGTILITGNLTITKAATWGSSGLPANIIVEGNLTQSNTLTLNGALYVGGSWTHTQSSITGDVCIGGNVVDNSLATSTIIGTSIPWFDGRSAGASLPQAAFYTSYQGANP
ncbi:MAG TPA: LamG domain-containing protein [Phycisphaerae bacterium]|jgi:hypothetical protein